MSLFGLLCTGALALLILGPEKFSGLAGQLRRALNELKRASAGLASQIPDEVSQPDVVDKAGKICPADMVDMEESVDREPTVSRFAAPDNPLRSPEILPKASFWAHLQELRKRFLYSAVSIGAGFAACWYFADRIFGFMQRPIVATLRRHHFDQQLIYLSPTEPFNLYMKIGLSAGLLLASPFILYQFWLFVSPALYRHEKRFVVPFVIATVALLLAGVLFGYTIVYPAGLEFLIGYGARFRPAITISVYADLFLTTILGLALVFELPVVVGLLGALGIVSAGWLWRNLRYSILAIFIVAGIITPTADILNMCIFAAPMVALYLMSIAVVWAVDPKQRKAAVLRRSSL